MVNIYEKVTKTALENLRADVDKKVNDGLKLWKLSCDKEEIYSQKSINSIRQYKACPQQTFLWIVEHILNKNIYNNHIVVDIEKNTKNGLYAGLIINELIKNNIEINQTSSALWRHIHNSNKFLTTVVKTHNGQMDVVKGLWDEILKHKKDIIKSRLKHAGINYDN